MDREFDEIKDKLLVQATLGDLEFLVRFLLHNPNIDAQEEKKQTPELIHGIEKLAAFIGCSDTTIFRRIRDGKFDSCISRNGRLLIFDKEKVMEIIKEEGWGMAYSKKGGKK